MQIKETVKIARTNKNYGGGSGRNILESDYFDVIHWFGSKGNYTELRCNLNMSIDINFDGHHDLDTDEKCFEQLTVSEIIQIIDYQKSESFELGKEDKAREIRECLYLSE